MVSFKGTPRLIPRFPTYRTCNMFTSAHNLTRVLPPHEGISKKNPKRRRLPRNSRAPGPPTRLGVEELLGGRKIGSQRQSKQIGFWTFGLTGWGCDRPLRAKARSRSKENKVGTLFSSLSIRQLGWWHGRETASLPWPCSLFLNALKRPGMAFPLEETPLRRWQPLKFVS